MGKRHSHAEFLFSATQFGQALSGGLIYENLLTGDMIESLDIDSLSLSGDLATFTGDCFDFEEPCAFTVTVQGNKSVNSFAITGTGFTPEAGNLTRGEIVISSKTIKFLSEDRKHLIVNGTAKGHGSAK